MTLNDGSFSPVEAKIPGEGQSGGGSGSHTPGPWRACQARADKGGCSCGHVWSLPADQVVATANTIWGDDLDHPYGEIPHDQMIANARLIAAAPELLGALTSMMAFAGQMTPRQFIDALYSIDSPGLELSDRDDLVAKLEAVVSQCWSAVAKATPPLPDTQPGTQAEGRSEQK